VDLRIRGTINFVNFINIPVAMFPFTFIPVQDCTDNIVDRMLLRYARRFSPELVADAKDAADVSFKALRGQIIYRKTDDRELSV